MALMGESIRVLCEMERCKREAARRDPPQKFFMSAAAWRKSVRRDAARDPKVIARFWAKADRGGGPQACWPWTGTGLRSGYGMFSIRKFVNISAHRFAYLIAHGRINSRLLVRHSCDNPKCVNPAHLIQGTHEDNSRDMVERGRASKGKPSRKLTDEQVREIRSQWAKHPHGQAALAAKYGLNRSSISHVVTRRTYADVE